jgi:hypothetical protein
MCDGTRKTVPGWEYQFVAEVGHLRTAWAALTGVERTTPADRTRQTARQIRNLLRRLRAAGHGGVDAPRVIQDPGTAPPTNSPRPGPLARPQAASSVVHHG